MQSEDQDGELGQPERGEGVEEERSDADHEIHRAERAAGGQNPEQNPGGAGKHELTRPAHGDCSPSCWCHLSVEEAETCHADRTGHQPSG